uniref:Cytochrome c oxidase subunit 3 n=1 Tax=Echyridella menziesii TaxID=981778 RepID=A0A1X9JRY8_9BIVA|nr:cytochrome c oxidase subunit 3 [Echyridella menziesii]
MRNPFHLVEASPWPLFGALGAFVMAVGFIDWFCCGSVFGLGLGLLLLIFVSFQWWRDVIRESEMGCHGESVAKGIWVGFVLFIVSEACLFFSFFWAYFHSSLSPCLELGCVWPPVGVASINPFKLPLLNTGVLIGSGVSVTWSHFAVLAGDRKEGLMGLFVTLVLGVYFLGLQAVEYMECSFSFADSVFGSLFYLMTGFHGLHVLVGVLFLSVCFCRLYGYGFSSGRHLGFMAAVWYWHFVVVWVLLYLCVYWWGM